MIRRELPLNSTTFLTASGHPFDFSNPHPGDVCLADVARALAKTSRYGGHVPGDLHLSVADHSCWALCVGDLLYPDLPPPARWALLQHDAAEYATGDVIKPLKIALGAAWDAFEARIQHVVFRALSVSPLWANNPEIKRADAIAYELERRWVFGWTDVELPPGRVAELVPEPGVSIAMPAGDAWALYLRRVQELAPTVGRPDLAQQAGCLIDAGFALAR